MFLCPVFPFLIIKQVSGYNFTPIFTFSHITQKICYDECVRILRGLDHSRILNQREHHSITEVKMTLVLNQFCQIHTTLCRYRLI